MYGNVQSQRHAKDNVHVNSSPQHLTLLLEHPSGFSRRGTWQIEIRKIKVDVASQAAVASLEARVGLAAARADLAAVKVKKAAEVAADPRVAVAQAAAIDNIG